MLKETSRRKIQSVTWVLMCSSPLLLFVFLSLAAHVRLGLGHWPTPMLESYNTAAYGRHVQVFVWVALFTVYAAVPLWLVALCFGIFRISLKTHLLQTGIYVAGWVLIALYGEIDPGRFVEWFLD
jgi:hypothetical protein